MITINLSLQDAVLGLIHTCAIFFSAFAEPQQCTTIHCLVQACSHLCIFLQCVFGRGAGISFVAGRCDFAPHTSMRAHEKHMNIKFLVHYWQGFLFKNPVFSSCHKNTCSMKPYKTALQKCMKKYKWEEQVHYTCCFSGAWLSLV